MMLTIFSGKTLRQAPSMTSLLAVILNLLAHPISHFAMGLKALGREPHVRTRSLGLIVAGTTTAL